MTHPIIKTDNYLLVVEAGIKEGERGLSINYAVYTHAPIWSHYGNKIIYHLPLNNAPTLEGVPLLPPLEDETRKLALEMGEDYFSKELFADYFTIGYNKAKEKYKYTMEDLRKAIDMARKRDEYLEWEWHSEKIIQSLQQPKYPVYFECEIETYYKPKINVNDLPYIDKPKTITNSQGLTQLVGKYIY